MIDRHGGRSVLAATNLEFATGLGMLTIAMRMGICLYEAAFATAAGLCGHGARNAITSNTLFSGLAGTVG